MERRYGVDPGNPVGTPENTAHCVEQVWSVGILPKGRQCSKKRGYGPDGLYCVKHAKVVSEVCDCGLMRKVKI